MSICFSILAEVFPELKYKISQAKPTCAMLTVFVANGTSFLPKAVVSQCDVRAGNHTQTHKTSLVVHVGAGVDALLGELGEGNLEALLD